jgi:hypothetical protein
MGSELQFSETPQFVVRAAGSFEQKPGCPRDVVASLGSDRVQRLCAGECYNPGDKRRRISRIEVIRITRQQSEDEPVGELIEDPWKTLECPPEQELCVARFEDPSYGERGRETLYYVRALQEPTPTVNGAGARCKDGVCEPCYGNYRTSETDDCLSNSEERAWSSPIYLLPGPSR